MNFTLKLNTDNAAFGDDDNEELARILEDTAAKIRNYLPPCRGVLVDAFGNTVGQWEFK